jgi:hypothetical protein
MFSLATAALARLFAAEPALIIGFAASVVILGAGHFGILLDKATVTSVLAPVITALLTRKVVSPAKKT